MNENLWGIDLGGTKVEGAVLQSASVPTILFRDRLPTEGHKGYEHILGQIQAVVEKMEAALGYRPKCCYPGWNRNFHRTRSFRLVWLCVYSEWWNLWKY